MASDKDIDLGSLRRDIDRIDSQIHQLLNERARCAQQVAIVKQREFEAAQQFESGTDSSSAQQLLFYRPEREAQVLERVKAANTGPLADDTVAYIFREIMSACLALEKPMEVAYLGPEGTYTQAAAIKHFGHAVISVPMTTIDAVFSQVESGQCHYGVVPVENSTEGMVSHTLDAFVNSSLKICGEVELRVRLNLLVAQGGEADITRICAHQQALAQSRLWLDANFPNIERVAVSSNGEAARIAAKEAGTAAIASDLAAQKYGLMALASGIEDQPDNTTRFLVIGRENVSASGKDKTSIVVSAHNRPGALFKLLEPFQQSNIMLTRIDTRPSRTETWTYVFFIEFEGHQDDPEIAAILDNISQQTVMCKILGSYPKAAL
ncbi:prephenate dehydratase [Spongiibacter sp. KMU-166]|uniref:Bifunctional chorismate mutase/prephenate dehydratase n=1 Tax=Spongiibacter thalassae TaxID=2721624 RepID=A0ABX1GCI1_9GAMM|nr:prephenate dehydratase [Spongiibacter thalassae]NKI16866.1 prephenate dehydratase [Spongiibacter thalassae]